MALNCEYILLAEFDIDEGSTLRHEYPVPTGCDAHLLAELMLPDGAHLRTEDWTVFYLNQTSATTVRNDLRDDGGADDSEELASSQSGQKRQQKDLIYVMSLVRTKHGAAYKRGALVKALAVCSRHPYIQVFKPVLLLALEDYFNEPTPVVLKRLYDSINSIDTSLAPQLSLDERLVLRHSERKDLFEEKFQFPDEQQQYQGGPDGNDAASIATARTRSETPTPASVLNNGQSSVTSHKRSSSTVQHAEDLPHLSIPSPTTSSAGAEDKPRTRVPSDNSTYQPSQMQPVPMRRSMSRSKGLRDTHFFDTNVVYNGLNLPIRLPLATFPDEVGDYSLITLIQTFSNFTGTQGPLHPQLHTNGSLTPPIIVLFNAMMTYKRVLFLGGSGQPASQVSNFVLSAAALGSGCGMFFGSDLVERCFPYSNLTNLDNQMGVPGYIAGVSNPRFEDLTSTWDVLCNIETGRIFISKDIQQSGGAHSSYSASSNASQLSLSTSSTTTMSTSGNNVPLELSTSPEPMSAISGIMPFGQHGQGIQSLASSNSDNDIASRGAPRELHNSSQAASSAMPKMEPRLDSSDNIFMDEIIQAIQSHFGEAVIRARFTDYVRRFVRLASRWEEDVFGATSIDYPSLSYNPTSGRLGSGMVFPNGGTVEEIKRELQSNTGRIEGWRRTKCYESYKTDWIVKEQNHKRAIKGMDLHHQIMVLRISKRMGNEEAEGVLSKLRDGVKTDEQVIELLSHLPSHFGGLLPVAFGLFHPSRTVRESSVDLLNTLNIHPTGSKFVASLNAFHRLAYARLAAERNSRGSHSRGASAASARSNRRSEYGSAGREKDMPSIPTTA